jgi:ATP-dependent DNA helicase RecQ
MLQRLRECFPGVALHGYTATATPRVQQDIVRQMRLADPTVLVGSFDRPNLIYRVQRRTNLMAQIGEIIDRHANEPGIIYCIRRADVDDVCGALAAQGLQALPYHAGLADDVRKANQEAFINDRAQIIVATVAFGMGIDKPDVRYVIHAGAPKSLEHYQQESGRAGRDGLEAECCLLFTGADFQVWRKIQEELPGEAYDHAMTVLKGIEQFCSGVTCRHRAIVEYFGQSLQSSNCQACDVCQGELDLADDALVLAQKIISCVARLEQSFGAEYTSQVLAGSQEQRILERGHNRLSTWGLLKEHDKRHVRDWIEQLVGQGCLEKEGEYQVLTITAEGRRVLRGELTPRLLKAAVRAKRSAAVPASWEGVDRGLFEALRDYRRRKADERHLAPFLLFSDETLRDMARRRPSTRERLLQVHGVGEKKCAEYGHELLDEIGRYCDTQHLERDVAQPASPARPRRAEGSSGSAAKRRAFELFKQGQSLEAVQQTIDRARSTTIDYLCEHIELEGICDASFWLDEGVCQRVQQVATQVGADRMKPIFDALGGTVPYDEIRIALACLRQAGTRAG